MHGKALWPVRNYISQPPLAPHVALCQGSGQQDSDSADWNTDVMVGAEQPCWITIWKADWSTKH